MRRRFSAIGMARIAALLMAVAIAFSACGGGPELDAALLRLELRYPISGQPDLRITGQEATAPRGSTIVCRSKGEKPQALGRVTAGENGSFELELESDAFPISAISGDFMDLNRTVECRANGGPWVSPLRPPLVAIG